jgi:hypothetical protein
MHTSLAKSGLREELRTVAQERLGTAEPFAWIESLRDSTRPALDLETRRHADDFVGDLLRRLDATRRQLGSSASDAAHATEADVSPPGASRVVEGVPTPADLESALDVLFGHHRARRVLASAKPDAARLAALIDEAEAILVDRLGDEG